MVQLLKKYSDDIGIYDIDSLLVKKLDHVYHVKNMYSAVTQCSRNILENKWKECVTSISDIIMSQNEYSKNILVTHLIYYNNTNREFFSVLNSTLLKDLIFGKSLPPITHVVLTVDDIYDTYFALAKDTELFGTPSLNSFLSDFNRMNNISTDVNDYSASIYISWLQYCLNSLLTWRAQELILSQHIAQELSYDQRCKFMLWAIKQDPRVLIKWISDYTNKIFYVSHPITEPRNYFRINDKWPDLINLINTIQKSFLDQGICTVMPTAIDELRLEKNKMNYTTNLTPRWPVDSQVKDALVEFQLEDDDIDRINGLNPVEIHSNSYEIQEKTASATKIQEYLNGAFDALELNIREQLGNRDHLLVWSTDGILVIEPFSIERIKIHGGVLKELQYLKNLNGKEESNMKRVYAIFLRNSLEKILSLSQFRSGYLNKLFHYLEKKHDLESHEVNAILDDNGNIKSESSSLGGMISIPKLTRIIKDLPDDKRQMVINEFLSRTMWASEDDLRYLTIQFIGKNDDLFDTGTLKLIFQFFTDGKSNDNWRRIILECARKAKLII